VRLRFINVLASCLILSFGFSGMLVAAPDATKDKDKVIPMTKVEKLIFEKKHLKQIHGKQLLTYAFERESIFGDAFKDVITLDVRDEAEADFKTIKFGFFTDRRRRPYPGFSKVSTNPLLTMYFNRDAWDLARRIKAKGVANYLRNRIMDGIGTVKDIEVTKVKFEGREIDAKRITFRPYEKDENRHNFVHYADLEYQITIAEDVPGMLYEIVSKVPPHKGEVPPHYIARLKKGGMASLAAEAEIVNKLKITDKPLIVERLVFQKMDEIDG